MLTPRWEPLRYHPVQAALWGTKARFCVVPAGRRSGKTELAKRKLVMSLIVGTRFPNARFAALAPTNDQARRIYWDDLKKLIPPYFIKGEPSESLMRIRSINGGELWVIGMDKPSRIEGSPWDGVVLDEYADMKPEAWVANVSPALSDRRGWAWLTGVPEGRNHYWKTYEEALRDKTGEWGTFSWKSADILPPEEIESARRRMDELTFRQEYEADFVTFSGRAYYPFAQGLHCQKLPYDPTQPLIFCFDFNISPGVAVVCQEMQMPGQFEVVNDNGLYYHKPVWGTGVIGEVYIPQNSNTPAVCRRLTEDWRHHLGKILCYGDATGGHGGTTAVAGSDWDLIKQEFGRYGSPFSGRVEYRVGRSNPEERARINAVNSRLLSATGVIRLMFDVNHAPHTVEDMDGVRLLQGGSGEIDERYDRMLTHLSDALGYYVTREFPIEERLGAASEDF